MEHQFRRPTDNPSSETTGWEPLAKTFPRMCFVVTCQYRRERERRLGDCSTHTSEVMMMHTIILLLLYHHRLTGISRTVPAGGPSLTLWSNLNRALCCTLRLMSILKNAKAVWLRSLYQGTDNYENNSNLSKVRNCHRWGWEFNG